MNPREKYIYTKLNGRELTKRSHVYLFKKEVKFKITYF